MSSYGRFLNRLNSGEALGSLDMTLWIFNLELNKKSPLLAAAHDWVEEFAERVNQVVVVSTHVGELSLPANVIQFEIGGGNLVKRIRGVWRLISLLPMLHKSRNKSIAFHHMSPRTALILGLPIKMLNIPQGLWYAHPKYSFEFRLSRFFVDLIFTSTKSSAPGKNTKYLAIGNGISNKRYQVQNNWGEKRSGSIAVLGRVSPIKKVENLLLSLKQLDQKSLSLCQEVKIYGPFDPVSPYYNYLVSIKNQLSLPVTFEGILEYSSITNVLASADLFYNGMHGSVDKSALEASLNGCLLVSENTAALELTGMMEVWEKIIKMSIPPLQEQLDVLLQIPEELKITMRDIVQIRTQESCGLEQTVSRILEPLITLRNQK
jgi:glycosyltransferase involved in cell wall biosynthesis